MAGRQTVSPRRPRRRRRAGSPPAAAVPRPSACRPRTARALIAGAGWRRTASRSRAWPAPARHGSRRPRSAARAAVRPLGLRAKDSPARSRGWHRDDGRRDRPPACAARSRARFQARSRSTQSARAGCCGCWRRASRSGRSRPTASGSRLPDRRCGARRLPAPRSRRRCRARSGTRPLRRRPRARRRPAFQAGCFCGSPWSALARRRAGRSGPGVREG